MHGNLVGVAVVGRPLSGQHQDRWVEVTRMASDGTPNVCSFLYGAAARAAFALGFARIQTYILASETGASLKASGWKFSHITKPPSAWHGRRPNPAHLRGSKQLWFQGEETAEDWNVSDWGDATRARLNRKRRTHERRRNQTRPPPRQCMNCGDRFFAARIDAKTCSPRCRKALQRKRELSRRWLR
jgi:predicted nucleic acid-binding Zn ribbon protein